MSMQQQQAKHLAARAVIAYRAGFPVEVISITTDAQSGIVCDWKQLRATYGNDDKLLRRGFAFVYMGTIVDQSIHEPMSEDLQKEMLADMSSALEARQTAVAWGLVASVTNTDPFAHGGYKLASRLLRLDASLIDALAKELCIAETMWSEQLKLWLDENAEPLELEELERSITF